MNILNTQKKNIRQIPETTHGQCRPRASRSSVVQGVEPPTGHRPQTVFVTVFVTRNDSNDASWFWLYLTMTFSIQSPMSLASWILELSVHIQVDNLRTCCQWNDKICRHVRWLSYLIDTQSRSSWCSCYGFWQSWSVYSTVVLQRVTGKNMSVTWML
jgi:hypothetical protein